MAASEGAAGAGKTRLFVSRASGVDRQPLEGDYEITELGRRYLAGDLDADDLGPEDAQPNRTASPIAAGNGGRVTAVAVSGTRRIRAGARTSVMNLPTDRLLLMLIVATGFVVLVGGWAGGLVEAESAGVTELALLGLIGAVFVAVLLGAWHEFRDIDEER